jgi:threonine dehydrogenase-like Zn-dependent dehydrogenase
MGQSFTLFSVPKAVTVTHHPESKACMATWSDLSAPCFREAVSRGLTECGRLHCRSWIVNLTAPNPGVPSQADLAWIQNECIQIAKDNGVVAVINVHGASRVASMGAKRWSKMITEGGLTTYDCQAVSDAMALAAEIAAGKTQQD